MKAPYKEKMNLHVGENMLLHIKNEQNFKLLREIE